MTNAPRIEARHIKDGDVVLLGGRYRQVEEALVGFLGITLVIDEPDKRAGRKLAFNLEPGAVVRIRSSV